MVAVFLSSNNKILQFRAAHHSFLNLTAYQLHHVCYKQCCFGIYFWDLTQLYLPYRSTFTEVFPLYVSVVEIKIFTGVYVPQLCFSSCLKNREEMWGVPLCLTENCGRLREKLT